MKKIFEKMIWWSGVVMFGLILGLSLQFVKAWTEPTEDPPGGNVGAPINTSIIEQLKIGALGINGLLKLYGGLQVPSSAFSGTPKPGDVLIAQPDLIADPTGATSTGQVAWAAGGNNGCRWYDFENVDNTGHVTSNSPSYKCAKIGDLKSNGATGICYIDDGMENKFERWGSIHGVASGGHTTQCPADALSEDDCWVGCGAGDGVCGVGNMGPLAGGVRLPNSYTVKYYGCK